MVAGQAAPVGPPYKQLYTPLVFVSIWISTFEQKPAVSLPVDRALAPVPGGFPVTVQVVEGVTDKLDAGSDPSFVNTIVLAVTVGGFVGFAPGEADPPKSLDAHVEFIFVVIPLAVFGLDKQGAPALTVSVKSSVPLE